MIRHDYSLKKHNTFGLYYRSAFFIPVKSETEAISLFEAEKAFTGPMLILGGGSNILFTSDFAGTIIHPLITGIDIVEEGAGYAVVSAGAGVGWDDLVAWTVEKGLGGLENLSLIPGTVGAAPVQNIGAYGVEVKDTILKVRAVSTTDGSVREFPGDECRFSYRNSIFKNELKTKYLITKVYFKLSTVPQLNLVYGSLSGEVAQLGKATVENVRKAVISIRRSKLPDPAVTGNAGSFFRNPVVDTLTAETLRKRYPGLPCYLDPSGGTKLAAGWLIDQCGWKGKRAGNAGIHDQQALIIVNYGKATGKELLDLSEEVRKSVWYRFEVDLEREVEVIGPT